MEPDKILFHDLWWRQFHWERSTQIHWLLWISPARWKVIMFILWHYLLDTCTLNGLSLIVTISFLTCSGTLPYRSVNTPADLLSYLHWNWQIPEINILLGFNVHVLTSFASKLKVHDCICRSIRMDKSESYLSAVRMYYCSS